MKTIAQITRLSVISLLLILSSCTTTHSSLSPDQVCDPLEPLNRKILYFNEGVDKVLLGPVSRGYNAVLPWWAKKGVQNFFRNIRYPVYLVSDVVQGKITQAGEHTVRFVVNTTAGVAGLVDVANEVGLPHHEEDLGTALGYHGVAPGPYLVIPFIGPSNFRDGFGLLIDQFFNPLSYTSVPVQVGTRVLDAVDTRRRLDDAIELGRESSLDYYRYLQSSYQQYREGLIHDKSLGTPVGPTEKGEPALDEDPFVGEESAATPSPAK